MDNDLTIRAGCLLVAEPYMEDAFFRRAVVLLTEHEATGSVGFMLNKELTYRVSDLVEGFPRTGHRVGMGGPVGHTTLNFLHTLGNVVLPQSHRIMGQIYWGGSFDVLSGLLAAEAVECRAVRFFLGYSGWSEGQLEAEVETGSWAVVPPLGYDLMEPDNDLWYRIVDAEPSLADWKLVPEDPADN